MRQSLYDGQLLQVFSKGGRVGEVRVGRANLQSSRDLFTVGKNTSVIISDSDSRGATFDDAVSRAVLDIGCSPQVVDDMNLAPRSARISGGHWMTYTSRDNRCVVTLVYDNSRRQIYTLIKRLDIDIPDVSIDIFPGRERR
jgi:hypothetical protein